MCFYAAMRGRGGEGGKLAFCNVELRKIRLLTCPSHHHNASDRSALLDLEHQSYLATITHQNSLLFQSHRTIVSDDVEV